MTRLLVLWLGLLCSGCCNVFYHCEDWDEAYVQPPCDRDSDFWPALVRGDDAAVETMLRPHHQQAEGHWVGVDGGGCSSIVEAVVKSGRCHLLEEAAKADWENFHGASTYALCFGVKYDFETLKRAVESGSYGGANAWIPEALRQDDPQLLKGLETLGADLDGWESRGGNLLANARSQNRPKISAFLAARGSSPRIVPVVRYAVVPVDTVGVNVSTTSGFFATIGLGVGLVRRAYELKLPNGDDDRWNRLDISAVLESRLTGEARRGASLRLAARDWQVGVTRLVPMVSRGPKAWRLNLGMSGKGLGGAQVGVEVEDESRRVSLLASFDVSILAVLNMGHQHLDVD